MDRLELMKALTDAPGVPGNESPVRQIMHEVLEPLGTIVRDNLGGILARRDGPQDGPKILLAGHLDEVGFMVSRITDDGFIKFQPLGGWWEQVMLAQRVQVETRNGSIPGIIGAKPPHLLSPEQRKKIVEKEKMFIDIGASSAEEAREWGVRPGDPIIPYSQWTPMRNEKLIMAKAWDNRMGCALAVEVLRELQNDDLPSTIFAGATVQEEIGLRGATTIGNLVQPQIAFALDVGVAGDTPGTTKDEAQGRLGGGPVLLIFDASMVPSTRLRDLIIDTAEELDIPLQFDTMARGGTDAGRFHVTGAGVPSVAFGIPSRYIHTNTSIIHRDDFDHAVKLLAAVIRKIDSAMVEDICMG